MNLFDENANTNSVGHKFNGCNYRLWKFQINAYMKAQGLTDNVEGNAPDSTASDVVKQKYDRQEGKAMNAVIQSLDIERANLVLTCKTAKEMIDKLSSIFEKNSEIRVMSLYEEYFSIKMREDETVASYTAKVTQLASEIEQQGEKLSDNLKMVRIISSLPPKFNNYKTVWYNTKDTRTIDTLMSSLQLEEDNLKRINSEESTSSAAFFAKPKKKRSKADLVEMKKKTKCHLCQQFGHWAKECPQKKISSKKNALAFCSVFGSNNEEDVCWFADSGASKHMTYHREWFCEYTEYKDKRTVEVANNECLEILGVGIIMIEARVNNQWEPRRLENVLYIPKLRKNLLSTAALTDKGLNVIIRKNDCKVVDKSNNVVAVGTRVAMNLLKMDFRLAIQEYANVATISLQQWHRRLGHINADTIKKMSKYGAVDGLELSDCQQFFCEDCQLGKMTRSTHKLQDKRPSSKGEYMHADLCGPMETTGIAGIRYFLLIKDEFTNFRYVYLIKSKDEVYECLRGFIPMINNVNGVRMKYFRSDNGTEFINERIENLMKKEGIQMERITPYTPEQNGFIERDNRTIQESARTMLIASGLPKLLWSEAVRTAVYLLNRTSNSNCIGSTPFEKMFGTKPNLSHIKIFGTECFLQIPKQTGRKKWDPKAKKVHLVGFEPSNKNFRLFDSINSKVIVSCNVHFNEIESKTYDANKSYFIEKYLIRDEKPDSENLSDSVKDVNESDEELDSLESTVFEDANDTIVSENDQTLARNNSRYSLRAEIHPPDRLIENAYSAIVVEPKSYEEAISSSESTHWKNAMDDEYNSLLQNHTWDLVQEPTNQKVIDNRWVFKVKQNTDGTIERYKARLVVRGFTQEFGVDYHETFSPVVKFTSIRAILSSAAMKKLQLKQFDIKTAFLYGDLKENVFMKQPLGYDDNSGRVCKLVKSLYGLKQSSRCWNQKFSSFIRKFEFKVCDSDTCVFIRHKPERMTIIAIYVDDGMIASDDSSEIECIVSYLQSHFEVKVFEARCFLGLEIERFPNGSIFVHQECYAKKVLNRFNMMNCKTVSTPADCGQNLGDFVNHTEVPVFAYREAVGSLMYLSVGTRPDISYAVGVVSRYLDHPSSAHVNAVKRIFKYIKGTTEMGILYKNEDNFNFVGYSDADYAGDSESRRSTSGYMFHIGSGIISWASIRQQSVSTSTTESEYVAACQAIKELIWLKSLITELNPRETSAAKFYMDNQSAIRLIKNPVYHKRTKHIDIQYHFIREKYQDNQFSLEYVSTDEQIADILTKALHKNRHYYLCNLINLFLKTNV